MVNGTLEEKSKRKSVSAPNPEVARVRPATNRALKDLAGESGQSAVFLAAIMGLITLGFLALALDVGYLFHEKRMAQAAADAAALAAAEELSNGATAEQNAANAMAKLNGFDTTLATNPAVVTLSQSSSGNYSNLGSAPAPATWIQAEVSRPIPTFFMGVFAPSMRTVSVAASAVAGAGAATSNCVCLEGTSGEVLNMSNDAQLSASGCQITVDSNSSNAIGVVGSASVCAQTISAVSTNWDNSGNINNNGTICSSAHVIQGGSSCHLTMTMPTLPSGINCYNNPIQGWVLPGYTANYTLPLQNVTLTNGTQVNEVPVNNTICYNSLDTSNAASVTFTPGYLYYIVGGFSTGGGAPVTGNGVTFYVGGNITLSNGVTSNLSAPTVGGVPQTLFYVNGNSVTVEGGSNSNFSGIVYAPNAAVTANNGTSTSINLDFVAQSLTMAGGATMNSFATPALAAGGNGTAKLAQ